MSESDTALVIDSLSRVCSKKSKFTCGARVQLKSPVSLMFRGAEEEASSSGIAHFIEFPFPPDRSRQCFRSWRQHSPATETRCAQFDFMPPLPSLFAFFRFTCDLGQECTHCVCMGLHPRLGADSPVHMLNADIMQDIARQVQLYHLLDTAQAEPEQAGLWPDMSGIDEDEYYEDYNGEYGNPPPPLLSALLTHITRIGQFAPIITDLIIAIFVVSFFVSSNFNFNFVAIFIDG
jgi:hypothetical protein